MNKIILQLLLLFIIVTMGQSCNKDQIPNPVTVRLESKLGKHSVCCRLMTTDLMLDTNNVVKEVAIDSLFMDTLSVEKIEVEYYGGFIQDKANENTQFLRARLQKNIGSDQFYTNDGDSFFYTSDPYSCKCTSRLYFSNDSLFFEIYRTFSYHYEVVCSGALDN